MTLYRVTVECEILVEGVSADDAENKVLIAPHARWHQRTIVLDQTVECDENGEEIEDN